MAHINSLSFASLITWLVRMVIRFWTWHRVVYHTVQLFFRLLILIGLWRFCVGQLADPCLPGCFCLGSNHMNCVGQRIEGYSFHPELRLPPSVNFRGAQVPWSRLPCGPFRRVKWMNLAQTGFPCHQAQEWFSACHLRVCTSIS